MNIDIGELGMREVPSVAFETIPPPHHHKPPQRPPVATDEPGLLLIFILAALIVAFGIHAPRIFGGPRCSP